MKDLKEYLPILPIEFFGRVAKLENQEGIFFNASGSGFRFCFTGTKAYAKLCCGNKTDGIPNPQDRAYINVFIDDMPISLSRFPLDKKCDWYTLAEGLPFGKHTVTVIKSTELGYGRAAVSAVKCDGELEELPKEDKLRLEFIGDSITCGYGNICSNASPEFVTREEDFSLTYAALTARLLNAELSTIAASGNGFYHDYGCNTHNLIPELYLYTDKMFYEHCGITPEMWDFEADKRDAVIIKLGQNDGQYCSGADLADEEKTSEVISDRRFKFQIKATEFLNQITKLRPNTPIILIVEADMYLKNELLNAARDVNGIKVLEITSKREHEGVGANGHWSIHTHSRVAVELAAFLKEELCLQ